MMSTQDSETISTLENIYRNKEELIIRDPINRRSFINRSAYAQLHRSQSTNNKRHSVDNLRGRFEAPSTEEQTVFTPADFGYAKTTKLKPPILRPKPVLSPKDENSNVVEREVAVVIQSASEESIDKIAKDLGDFEMDNKKEKKRIGSFRRLLFGGFFTKDKKKKDEKKVESRDNITNSNRRDFMPQPQSICEAFDAERQRQLDQEYARNSITRFNNIRQQFDNEDRNDNYVTMECETKPTITDTVDKYIDTSSSTSTESGVVVRDTPPRAQETFQNITVVKPKATIPLNSERPLPNPYKNETLPEKNPSRTHLNFYKNDSFPEKNITKSPSNLYKTEPPPEKVITRLPVTLPRNDNYLEGNVIRPSSSPSRIGISPDKNVLRPPLSPLKLKLPPNREIYEPQPRVKSPIPPVKVSTEKIIATELLKSVPPKVAPPPPPKRSVVKPPVAPKIVTNALVHNRSPQHAVTPFELRQTVSMKLHSPDKEDVRKSVEEFYWKQLKKMKEEEDMKLNEQMGGNMEEARLKRSRSLSPTRRSYYANRDRTGNVDYVRVAPIPEDRALTSNGQIPFAKNKSNNGQKPIFRRGSLTQPEIYETSPYNKSVSFSGPQYHQNRLNSDLDDEVFIQSTENLYANRVPNEPLYSNRVLEQWRAQQYYNQMDARRLSMVSIPYQQENYGNRQGDLYGQRPNPNGYAMYSTRQNIPDPTYGQRQVNMRTRYCDIYGQIHDSPNSGIIMGRLQQSPRQNFVRGSRLTASVSDIGRRSNGFENRPLPPQPRYQISDTESGSDASEVQRIMTRRKRGVLAGK